MSSADTTKIEKGNVLCGKCGAEVRQGSLFCYACGADLAALKPTETVKAEPTKKSKRSKRSAQIATADLKAIPKPEAFDPTPETGENGLMTNIVVDEPTADAETVNVDESKSDETPLRSAAAVRRQNRARKTAPATVDVRWEPRSGMDLPFLIGSFIFLLIAGLILAAAVYLK